MTDRGRSLRDKQVFFPPEKFNGKDKTKTKQHWQIFKDFCEQQKIALRSVPARGDDEAIVEAPIEEIGSYFKMTLTELARNWFDRNRFTNAADLERKFHNDFSPYGKTENQWLNHWYNLKFDKDNDNIDEFLDKFEDLAHLIGVEEEFKLKAFRVVMPYEVQIQIKDLKTYGECAQAARDLMTIIQNPITNKISTLSLLESRSPSPTPRPRPSSPGPARPAMVPRQSRSRERRPPRPKSPQVTFQDQPQYLPTSPPRPQSRPPPQRPYHSYQNYQQPQTSFRRNPFNNYNNQRGRGRGRGGTQRFFRPRSVSRNRQPLRCYNCGIIGHIARNCFTRTPIPRNGYQPNRFTPNQPPKRLRNAQNNRSHPPQFRGNNRPRNYSQQWNNPPDWQNNQTWNDPAYQPPQQPQYTRPPTPPGYPSRYPDDNTYSTNDNSYPPGPYDNLN